MRASRSVASAALSLVVVMVGMLAVFRSGPGSFAQTALMSNGHTNVVAQGVASPPAELVAWRVTYHTSDLAPAQPAIAGPGFVAAAQGELLISDGDRPRGLLLPGEALFVKPGAIAASSRVEDLESGYFLIDLVPDDKAESDAGGMEVYASDAFNIDDGLRDINLLRDVLQDGEETQIGDTSFPVVVLATRGELLVESEDGSSAELKIGEGISLAAPLTITATGGSAASFFAGVLGPSLEATESSTPAAETTGPGSLTVVVYGCPQDIDAKSASPETCDPVEDSAVLDLVSLDGEKPRSLDAPTMVDGLPVWEKLPLGRYAIRATEVVKGYKRYLVPGLQGVATGGERGFAPGGDNGYELELTESAPEGRLDLFLIAGSGGSAQGGVADVSPDAEASATAVVTTTAVATPTTGSITVAVYQCPDPYSTFDPARCVPAASPYDLALYSDAMGATVTLANATPTDAGWVFDRVPFGDYILSQTLAPPGSETYVVVPGVILNDASGYVFNFGPDVPQLTVVLYALSPAVPVSTAVPEAGAAPVDTAPVTEPVVDTAIDSDGDALTDDYEINVVGTNPNLYDSDGDGYSDGYEWQNGGNPLRPDDGGGTASTGSADSDGDGMTDDDEYAWGTDPYTYDTDGDGWGDGDEVNAGSDPFDPASVPA